MKLNPTFLEITLAFLVSLSVYLWVKYGKRIKRWWQEMHIRHRRPRRLRPREPADCPQCATGVHWLPKHPGGKSFPGHRSRAHVDERNRLIQVGMPA
jgi:hypothetical protein